ncbi:Cys-tRNA(Pro) deacylase [[Eubacterium] hominis]|uniref:Cys-tRNA(Pro) deacylase n=1 Tax=[Eubacterium] hominis TaxID=2764325 RepID=UPI003A4D2431
MKKLQKTNAMRILDREHIPYNIYTYEHGQDAVDGLQVAQMLHQNPEMVFKTLVTIANTKEHYVFVVPVAHELDLKKCAKAVGVKSVEMIHVKDINKVSGYIRGGCSPIGMKKTYVTTFHESCLQFDTIIFSGGKIGVQIEMSPKECINLLHAKCYDIIKSC